MMARVRLPSAFITKPLAHRGYHDQTKGRPENSPSAFRAAIEAGYGIELDVQLASDGQAVVFHDETLDRMTSRTGAVIAHTAKELTSFSLAGSNDLIPTLAQVLALVAGRVPLLIEIKDVSETHTETTGRLEAATAAAIAHYEGPVAVMSFNPHFIAEMARLAPGIPRGLTTGPFEYDDLSPTSQAVCDQLRSVPDYDRTESSFISHCASDLDRPRVAALKAQGASILCWTIRSLSDEEAARKIAHNITFEHYAAAFPA